MTVTLQLGSSERAVTEEPGVVHFGYRPALDGLRTVAVYLVVLYHAGVAQFEGGFIGVDLFFVLSGYLVTSVMLTEYDANGRIDLVRFYARRIRRLLPAAVLTIVAVAVTSLLVDTPLTRSGYLGAARSGLLYVSNWHFIGDKTDYFAADADRNPYLHFWSLSVEEQFYAAFPVVLIALLFIVRGRRVLVAGLLGAITVALVGVQLFWWDRNPVRAYYGTDARTYQMAGGALLAVALTVPAVRRATARLVVSVTGPLAAVTLAGLVVASTEVVDVNASVRGFIAAGAATLLIAALECSGGTVGWALSRQTMVQLGRVSYGTYLWHWPIIVYAREVLDLGPVSLAGVATVGATAMAFLSSTLIEMPIRTTPHLANRSPQVVFNGLLASVFVAVALVPPIFNNDRLPVVTAARQDGLGVSGAAIQTAEASESSEPTESTPDSPTTEVPSTDSASPTGRLRMTADMTFVTIAPDERSEPSEDPEPTEVADDTQPASNPGTDAGEDAAAFDDAALPAMLSPEDTVPSDIDLAAASTYPIGMYECSESEPEDCTLHEGSGPSVFVIGDSNASMLIPMFQELAEEHDFTLSATTAGGCTWQEGLGWVVEDENRLEECLRIRDDAYERVLPALQPDIVIGIHIPRDDPARGDYSPFFPLDESNGPGFDGIVAATRTTLDDLEALGTQVIIIEPLPYTIADTVECLSGTRYVLECAFEATTEPIPMEELYRDEADEREAVSSVDLDPIFCPAKPICAPIVDDELIFRDAFHVYPPYAVDHRDQVWELLGATGAFDT